MVKGSLQYHDMGTGLKALLYRYVDLPSVRLGGLHGGSEYVVTLEPPSTREPLKALLEVGMLVRDVKLPKWRLWVNTVAVTREFKPSLLVEVSDVGTYYAKVVYDLKPIVLSTRAPYRIVIQYEGSPEIEVNDISFTALYPDEDSETSYHYYSGAVLLSPGDSIAIDLPAELENAVAHLVFRVPNRAARLRVSCGEQTTVQGVVGPYEVRVPCSEQRLSVVYEAGKEINYYPRIAILSSVLLERSLRKEPDFQIGVAEEEGALRVSITNVGSAAPETLMVIALRPGAVLDRAVIESLEPGASTAVSLRGAGSATAIRVVWRYKGETRFKELKLKGRKR